MGRHRVPQSQSDRPVPSMNISHSSQTIAALDSMDDNLRRLGLSGRGGAADTMNSNSAAASSAAYMSRIREAKVQRRKLQQEAEVRRCMLEETHSANTHLLNEVTQQNSTHSELEKAQALLQRDAQRAGALAQRQTQRELEIKLRQERLEATETRRQHHSSGACEPSRALLCPPYSAMEAGITDALHSDTLSSRTLDLEDDATRFCRSIAEGLAHLAIRVSDNRYLQVLDMTGSPVRRVDQDLPVTQWRQWVRESIYSDPQAKADLSKTPSVIEPLESNPTNASHLPSGGQTEELREDSQLALKQLLAAAHHTFLHNRSLQSAALADAIGELHTAGERARKEALEGIRRRYTGEGGALVAREEVVPRWSQRMPPAGCLIFGDDLSGAHLLAETVDQALKESQMPTGEESAHDSAASLISSSRSAVGLTIEVHEIQTTYVTPRTLLGSTGTTSGKHVLTPTTARLRSATANRTASARDRGVSADECERREHESLAEALTKELVAVHAHNIAVLSDRKRRPAATHAPVAVEARGGKKKAPAAVQAQRPVETAPDANDPPKPEEPARLQSLFLVGFPEAECFYHVLQQKLLAAVEVMELNIVAELQETEEVESEPVPLTHIKGRKFSMKAPQPPARLGPATSNHMGRPAKNGGRASIVESSASMIPLPAPKYAIPPLCVMGYFLEYDIPTRYARLKGSYTTGGAPVNQSLPTPISAGTTANNPPLPQLWHSLYRPEIAYHIPPSQSPSDTKVTSPFGAVEKSAMVTMMALKAKMLFKSMLDGGKRERVSAWDLSKLRSVVVQQDSRMRQWQSQWKAAVVHQAQPSSPFEGMQMRRNSSFSAATAKARKKTLSSRVPRTTSGKPGDGSPPAGSDVPQPVPTRGHVPTGHSGSGFPRVLFFGRTKDISDTAPCGATVVSAGNQSIYSPKRPSPDETKRVAYVNDITMHLREVVQPAARLLTNEALVPEQMPPPLRLSDYGLHREAISELIATHKHYSERLLPFAPSSLSSTLHMSDSPVRGRRGVAFMNRPVASSPTTKATRERVYQDALHAEVEVHRVLLQQLTEMLHVIHSEAFQSELWETAGGAPNNPTSHYTAIDRNFEAMSAWVRGFGEQMIGVLRARCAVLVRYVVDAALSSTAEALQLLCERIHYSFIPPVVSNRSAENSEPRGHAAHTLCVVAVTQVAGSPAADEGVAVSEAECNLDHGQTKSRLAEGCEGPRVRQEFLQWVPRLAPEEVEKLITHILTEGGTRGVWELLDGYAASVREVGTECVMRFIDTLQQTAAAAGVSDESAPLDNHTRTLNPMLEVNWNRIAHQMVGRVMAQTFVQCNNEIFNAPSAACSQVPLSGNRSRGISECGLAEGSAEEQTTSSVSVTLRPKNLLPVAPYLARVVRLVMWLLKTGETARHMCEVWLTVMYRTALATPCEGPYPKHVRPRNVGDLLAPPPIPHVPGTRVIAHVDNSAAYGGRGASLSWPALRYEMLVETLALYSTHALTQEAFVHCHALAQLELLVPFLKDVSASLAQAIAFPHIPSSVGHASRSTVVTLLYTYHLMNAPCRCPEMRGLPYYSVDEMRMLFQQQVSKGSMSALSTQEPRIDLYEWGIALALGRICFCGDPTCSLLMKHAVPEPTIRELRRFVASLPPDVLRQRCSAELVSLIPAFPGELPGWDDVHWWHQESHLSSDRMAGQRLALQRTLTAHFVLTREGVLQYAVPPLPLVLKLLATSRGAAQVSLVRLFHSVAAVVGGAEREEWASDCHRSTEEVPPLAAYHLRLSVDEFLFFFSAFFAEWPSERMRQSNPTEDARLLVPLRLRTDVQLLLQEEAVNDITLPLLLSSHWARMLMDGRLSAAFE